MKSKQQKPVPKVIKKRKGKRAPKKQPMKMQKKQKPHALPPQKHLNPTRKLNNILKSQH
jgi:hypothetical protein